MKKKVLAISILSCITADFIKLKNSSLILISICGAVFIPLLVFFMYFFNSSEFIPQNGENSWIKYINANLKNISFFVLPFFIILASSLIHRIEHRSNAWKNLLCLPHSKLNLYLSKLFSLAVSIILTYVIFITSVVLLGVILGQTYSDLDLNLLSIPFDYLCKFLIHSFISILGIFSIHNAASLLIKNQIVVIAIGLMFTIIAGIFFMHEKMIYFPYSYPILTLINLPSEKTDFSYIHEVYSVLYFLAFNIIGVAFFSKKDLK